MPAASNVPAMLVEQAITVEKAGMVRGAPDSISTSRARFDHCSEGITAPQTIRSGAAPSASIALTTGVESCRASYFASAPFTRAKGVRRPAASHTSGFPAVFAARAIRSSVEAGA
jgi:hypothetical protein